MRHVAHADPEPLKPSEASTIDLSLSKKIRLANSESGEMPSLVQSCGCFMSSSQSPTKDLRSSNPVPLLPRASRSTNNHGSERQNTLAEGTRTAWQCSLLPSLFNIIHMVFCRIWTGGILTSAYGSVLQATTCVISCMVFMILQDLSQWLWCSWSF